MDQPIDGRCGRHQVLKIRSQSLNTRLLVIRRRAPL